MIIDIHTHIFPEKIADRAISGMEAAARAKRYIDATEFELRKSMERAGIDLSVNLPVATNPAQPRKLNIAALEMNKRTRETGILSFGAMHPEDENWREELEFISENGIPGIKLHPMYQGVSFDDIKYTRILEEAQRYGLIVIVHSGYDIGVPGEALLTPRMAVEIQKRTGIEKLILAHMGGWGMWQEVSKDLVGAPIYIDTAFSFGEVNENPKYPRKEEERALGNDELLFDIIERHGADKVLFGTDSPWGSQAADVERMKKHGFSDSERELIFEGNARRLLAQANDDDAKTADRDTGF